MINESKDQNTTEEFQSESNILNETTSGTNRIKEIGLKSLQPLLDVVSNHKGDLNPFFQALSKALHAGVDSLNQPNASDAERSVGNWFRSGSDWFDSIQNQLQNKNGSELLEFLEKEAQSRPGLMFGISYLAGIGLGRIGRHVGRDLNRHAHSDFNQSVNIDSTIH